MKNSGVFLYFLCHLQLTDGVLLHLMGILVDLWINIALVIFQGCPVTKLFYRWGRVKLLVEGGPTYWQTIPFEILGGGGRGSSDSGLYPPTLDLRMKDYSIVTQLLNLKYTTSTLITYITPI